MVKLRKKYIGYCFWGSYHFPITIMYAVGVVTELGPTDL